MRSPSIDSIQRRFGPLPPLTFVAAPPARTKPADRVVNPCAIGGHLITVASVSSGNGRRLSVTKSASAGRVFSSEAA